MLSQNGQSFTLTVPQQGDTFRPIATLGKNSPQKPLLGDNTAENINVVASTQVLAGVEVPGRRQGVNRQDRTETLDKVERLLNLWDVYGTPLPRSLTLEGLTHGRKFVLSGIKKGKMTAQVLDVGSFTGHPDGNMKVQSFPLCSLVRGRGRHRPCYFGGNTVIIMILNVGKETHIFCHSPETLCGDGTFRYRKNKDASRGRRGEVPRTNTSSSVCVALGCGVGDIQR